MKRLHVLILLACSSAASLAVGYALAQQAQPSSTPASGIGIKRTQLATIDLGHHFEAMKGQQLVMTYFVVEPKGISAVHNHKGRPELIYLIKGQLEEREGGPGGTVRVHKTGTGFISNANDSVSHTMGNPFTEVSESIGVSIGPKPAN
jgi:quercetin dioxygenase-like cupin family protein